MGSPGWLRRLRLALLRLRQVSLAFWRLRGWIDWWKEQTKIGVTAHARRFGLGQRGLIVPAQTPKTIPPQRVGVGLAGVRGNCLVYRFQGAIKAPIQDEQQGICQRSYRPGGLQFQRAP